MGLGILEPRSAKHVQGTSKLFDDQIVPLRGSALRITSPSNSHLKHGVGRDADILLVPQPSGSPNDPLNWPLWKRDSILLVLCAAGAVASVVGPAVAPIAGILVKDFDTTYTEVSKWSGWQFWASGIAGLLSSAVSRVYGKRPVYVVSVVLSFAGTLWNAFATSPNSFLAARFIQGLGLGAFETIVPCSIGDMFFVHQRGSRVALYNLCFLGATYFMPVLGGYISVRYGWRTQFIIIAAFLGPLCLLVFLFVPEHTYVRAAVLETDMASSTSSLGIDRGADTNTDADADPDSAAAAVAAAERPHTFVQQLRLYNGRFSGESLGRSLLAPFVLFIYPATLWAFLFQGTFITWGIGVSIVLAQIFTAPPFLFNPEQLGYMYAAPFVGALASYAVAGVFSDTVAKAMARRNNNIFEPEFRIALVAPVAVVALPGIFVFGAAAVAPHAHWIVPSICYGLLTFGVVMSCTATYSYLLDSHRAISVEMMVSVLLLKNCWAFGSTFFLNNWLTARGPRDMFFVIGGVQAAVCLASVPMYVFGKILRCAIGRFNPLGRVGLDPVTVGGGGRGPKATGVCN